MHVMEACADMARRFRRISDGYISFRKLVLLIIVILILLVYLLPSLLPWRMHKELPDVTVDCLNSFLQRFSLAAKHSDVNVQHVPVKPEENNFLPFVGNGYIGLPHDGFVHLKTSEAIDTPIPFHPFIRPVVRQAKSTEAVVTDYMKGTVQHIQSFFFHQFQACLEISSSMYAHRMRPSLLVQEINLQMPPGSGQEEGLPVELQQQKMSGGNGWPKAKVQSMKSSSGQDYQVITGTVLADVNFQSDVQGKNVAKVTYLVAVASVAPPAVVYAKPGLVTKVTIISSVAYMLLDSLDNADDDLIMREASLSETVKTDLELALDQTPDSLYTSHVSAWSKLWQTGFSISKSLAPGALNGDVINATIYLMLSNADSPMLQLQHTKSKSSDQRRRTGSELLNLEKLKQLLSYADRCYDYHHTLQSSALWSSLDTMKDISVVVRLWRLTLQKHGCAELLKAGADGVIQAMVLSFGGFKFSHHHLEFKTEPKDLHRDYSFRRISYGNGTHVNITVHVRDEDNKAVLGVALDRSDRDYWACDAGCIDPPVKLGAIYQQFPVKKTDPFTAILYITADRKHVDDIKQFVHVKEVIEAPAHEHQVIALHRHGHHLGGLPTIFWVSIVTLIAVFHLFLLKLIYNEYCSSSEKIRYRYNL